MSRMSNPDDDVIRRQQAIDAEQDAKRKDAEKKLEERIERLEKRIEGSVLGEDGVASVRNGAVQDETQDALEKAVDRANRKRKR